MVSRRQSPFGLTAVFVAALVSGSTGTDEYRPIALDMYHEMWEPYVTVVISSGDHAVRRGAGVLVEKDGNTGCHVYAFTNHHVVYGEESLNNNAPNIPDLDGSIATVELAYKTELSIPEMHLAKVVRTSKSADASLLLVPRIACGDTPVARLATDNKMIKIGATDVWHVTSAGGDPADIEIIPAHITRFGSDKYGNITLSSTLPVVLGMSGSPVFVQTWRGYEIIGIVEGREKNKERPNYIVPSEILHVLLNAVD